MEARVLALVLVLAVLPLAGCFDFLKDPPKEEATAGELLSVARAEAASWRAGARLASAGTVEYANLSEDTREGNATFQLPDDPEVGNGRGVFWAFEFVDPATGDSIELGVAAANRSVFVREEDDGSGNKTVPDRTWSVDSDAAVARARGNASFARAVDEADATGWTTFYFPGGRATDGDDGGPRWGVVAYGEGGAAVAFLNATSGEVLHAGNFSGFDDFDLGGLGGSIFAGKRVLYEEEEEGQLTVAAATAQVEFPVGQRGASASVQLCYGRSTPTGAVSLEIVGPDGKTLRPADGGPGAPAQGGAGWEESDLAPGKYLAKLALKPGGVAADWHLTIEVYTGSSFDVNPFPC